jgi:hypothetical protein
VLDWQKSKNIKELNDLHEAFELLKKGVLNIKCANKMYKKNLIYTHGVRNNPS